MIRHQDRTRPFAPSPSRFSQIVMRPLFALLLLGAPAGALHSHAAEAKADQDKATLFYASFDESLEANEAKGEWAPVAGHPNITTEGGGKHGESIDLTPLEYPLGYTTLAYELDGNLSLEAGTVEFWYKPEFTRAPDGEHPFMSYFLFDIPTTLRDKNNQVVRVSISVSENGGVRKIWLASGMQENEGTPTASAVIDWVAGEWHHVAMTWDAEEILLYLDGIPVASIYAKGGLFGGNKESIAALAGKFCLGGVWQTSAGASAGGYIDEFRISNKAFKAERFEATR